MGREVLKEFKGERQDVEQWVHETVNGLVGAGYVIISKRITHIHTGLSIATIKYKNE
jgi:hypothetical protein